MKTGLYDHLLTESLKAELATLSDARLGSLAPVDPDDAHAAVAQFLEHALIGCFAAFRGRDAADRQRRLVGRIVDILKEELDAESSSDLSTAEIARGSPVRATD